MHRLVNGEVRVSASPEPMMKCGAGPVKASSGTRPLVHLESRAPCPFRGARHLLPLEQVSAGVRSIDMLTGDEN